MVFSPKKKQVAAVKYLISSGVLRENERRDLIQPTRHYDEELQFAALLKERVTSTIEFIDADFQGPLLLAHLKRDLILSSDSLLFSCNQERATYESQLLGLQANNVFDDNFGLPTTEEDEPLAPLRIIILQAHKIPLSKLLALLRHNRLSSIKRLYLVGSSDHYINHNLHEQGYISFKDAKSAALLNQQRGITNTRFLYKQWYEFVLKGQIHSHCFFAS